MSICTAPVYKMEKLNNLFIELTAKNCNRRCKICYLDFPNCKTIKDFISTDKIKIALKSDNFRTVNCIYLTGAEPMTHPDFNFILRLCLKKCDVCICTNGATLNEKKIRFLKKVEDEGNNQILFKLSLAHYSEYENDNVKYRGNFRQTIFALKTLCNYNFNSVLAIQNFYNLDKNEIVEMFKNIFVEQNIFNTDLQINSSHPDLSGENFVKPSVKTDCMFGRVLTETGIYSCPFLSSDYRGRCGINLDNFSEIVSAETEFCSTCSKNNSPIFTTE